MGHFNKFEKGRGGRGGFSGGGHNFGGGPRQMFQAVCSKCGQNCEVPFKPTGERPVFCNNCFKSQKQDGGGQRFAPPRSFGSGNSNAPVMGSGLGNKGQFDALNAKLDKIISLLSAGKPATASHSPLSEKPKKVAVKKAKKAAKKGKKK